MRILITGGAGFIGSHLIRLLLSKPQHSVLNLDTLTYAGNRTTLEEFNRNSNYQFQQLDLGLCSIDTLSEVLENFAPDWIMHLAAESHVDRSIDSPANFIRSNIIGTYHLLEASRRYFTGLNQTQRDSFRFLHVSTDEVYGSLSHEGLFSEESAYDPRSPYSASKASADHLVRAWHNTYQLPTLITNSSNSYGPNQYPEKLIPVVILHALCNQPIPIFGSGQNVRDWLYVEDHVAGLYRVIQKGQVGQSYNLGGENELTNIQLVHMICDQLDQLKPREDHTSYREQISFVADRPGHDHRYALDITKISKELGWRPQTDFTVGLELTIRWYLEHPDWLQDPDRLSG